MNSVAFSANELRERVARIQALMESEGLDVLVLTEKANFEYVSSYQVYPLWASYARILAAIVPKQGPPILLAPDFIANHAERASGWMTFGYRSIGESPMEQLAAILHEHGGQGRIGVERSGESRLGLPLESLDNLTGRFANSEFVDGSAIMWRARANKSHAEIERIRLACAAAGEGYTAAFGKKWRGQLESQLAREVEAGCLGACLDSSPWTSVGWIAITSGPGSYDRFLGHPRQRSLENNDMVWVDLGVNVEGYWSDFSRAAVVGGASVSQESRQRIINEVTAAGVAMARPGVPVADIAREMRRLAAAAGLPMLGYGRLGHGIGLTATEPPSIVETDETILEGGMVIAIEPAAVTDDGLYCAEQIVAVSNVPEVLSTCPTSLAAI